MADKRQYREHNFSIASKPFEYISKLINSNLCSSDYNVYEKEDCWYVCLGCIFSVSVRGRNILVNGKPLDYQLSDLSDIASIMGNIDVNNWRAFGTANFELSHLFLDIASTGNDRELLYMSVPQTEICVNNQHVTMRSMSDDSLLLENELKRLDLEPPAPNIFDEINDNELTIQNGRSEYESIVTRCVNEIAQGQYKKAIISRPVTLPSTIDIKKTFLRGRKFNTPARSFIMRRGPLSAAGFSPETVVEVSGSGFVSTQPLAGTRAMSSSVELTQKLCDELIGSNKEIAEHAMSVKLSCMELQEVCDSDSISVDEFMSVCQRGSVQHLGSRVSGQLKQQNSCWDAFQALFPAVTASGIPKKEAISAIQRLEGDERGLYSGAFIMLDSSGNMDAALILRSIFQTNNKTWLRAGAGIIEESKSEREFLETCEKLESVFLYLQTQQSNSEIDLSPA